jgi:hypothetical protein
MSAFALIASCPFLKKKTFLKGQANKHLMFSEFSLQVFRRQADEFFNYYIIIRHNPVVSLMNVEVSTGFGGRYITGFLPSPTNIQTT